MSDIKARPDHRRYRSWRLVPVVVLAGVAVAFFAFGLHDYLSFETLRAHRGQVLAWVDDQGLLAGLAYMIAYGMVVVFIPPSGTLMTVFGGFIFGAVAGTFWVVVGATAGATVLFLTAKLALGDFLRERAGPAVRKMEAGFKDNESSYMLVLRLVPLFPFWLVNLAPAFLGVRLRTYVFGTLFGIIPGSAVYATFGAGLGSILDNDEVFSLSGVMTPQVVAGLIGLALLALIPVGYKRYKKRP